MDRLLYRVRFCSIATIAYKKYSVVSALADRMVVSVGLTLPILIEDPKKGLRFRRPLSVFKLGYLMRIVVSAVVSPSDSAVKVTVPFLPLIERTTTSALPLKTLSSVAWNDS